MVDEQVAPGPWLYDVAVSYASEDRPYAAGLAKAVQAAGYRVFIDAYQLADMWGKELYSHLADVYSRQARYCVMFLSASYRDKLWTKHERQAAQERAFRESREYILPVRVDDAEIPGLLGTVAYMDLRTTSIERIAELVLVKLRDNTAIEASQILSRAVDQDSLTVPPEMSEPVDAARPAARSGPAPVEPDVTERTDERFRAWVEDARDRVGRSTDAVHRELVRRRSEWPGARAETAGLLRTILRHRLDAGEFDRATSALEDLASLGLGRAEIDQLAGEVAERRSARARLQVEIDDRVREAEDLIAMQDWAGAIRLLTSALQRDPEHAGIKQKIVLVHDLRSTYGFAGELLAAHGAGRWGTVVRMLTEDRRTRRIPPGLLTVRLQETLGMSAAELLDLAITSAVSGGTVDLVESRAQSLLPAACTAIRYASGRTWIVVCDKRGNMRTTSTLDTDFDYGLSTRAGWSERTRIRLAVFDSGSLWLVSLSRGGSVEMRSSPMDRDSAAVVRLKDRPVTSAVAPAISGLLGFAVKDRIELWDVHGAAREFAGYRHPGHVRCLEFTGDNSEIALTACDDLRVRLWDVAREEILVERTLPTVTEAIATDSQGRVVAALGADRRVRYWPEFEDGTAAARSPEGPSTSVDVSSDGRLLLLGRGSDGVELWDVRGGSSLSRRSLPAAVTAVRFAPGSWTCAVGGEDGSLRSFEVVPADPAGPRRRAVVAGS